MSPDTYLKIGILGILGFALFFMLWLGSREDKTINASLGSLIIGMLSLFRWFLIQIGG